MISNATLIFPEKYKNNKIQQLIKDQYAEVTEYEGFTYISDEQAWQGCFEELEKYMVENKIPFDRHTESSPDFSDSIRYYRPSENYDVEIDVDYERHSTIRIKDIFDYMQQYTSGSITQSDLVIEIANLIKEKDPLLTKQIKPLEYYIKADDTNE